MNECEKRARVEYVRVKCVCSYRIDVNSHSAIFLKSAFKVWRNLLFRWKKECEWAYVIRSWGLFSKKRPRDHFCPHTRRPKGGFGGLSFTHRFIKKKIGLPFTFPSVFILFHRLTFENRSNKNTRKKSLSPKRKEVVQIITQAYKHII